MHDSPLSSLVRDCDLLICSGAGGVGKTTTSAAIGLAGALAGRRAVVLTIDPARRLADALGLEHLPNEAVAIRGPLLEGAAPGGSLHALMLDPKQTFDNLVTRLQSAEEAAHLFQNRLYQNVTGMIAGIQEYAAGEKLHELAHDPRFDLVVVDTPPTRNALDFLEAPSTLSRFLDERVLRWFAPQAQGRGPFARLRRTGKVVGGVLGSVFGEGFAGDLSDFLGAMGGLTVTLREHAEEVRRRLASPEATFLLVTAPHAQALDEALFFRDRLEELGLPFGGYVVNRLYPERPDLSDEELQRTGEILRAELGDEKGGSVLERLETSYRGERARALQDRQLLERLRRDGKAPIVGIPRLDGDGAVSLGEIVERAFRVR